MLYICLATFISFVSYTKVHLIHFIDHSPFHSYLPYLVILKLHYSTSFSLSFFNQSRVWKLGVSLDKVLIWNTLHHLKLNADGVTTRCYYTRITTGNIRDNSWLSWIIRSLQCLNLSIMFENSVFCLCWL